MSCSVTLQDSLIINTSGIKCLRFLTFTKEGELLRSYLRLGLPDMVSHAQTWLDLSCVPLVGLGRHGQIKNSSE